MNKQEKIDWGLRKLIGEWMGEEGTTYLYDFSRAIRTYLHSQGVVIKVDGKMPEYKHPEYMLLGDYGRKSHDMFREQAKMIQRDMLKASYVAVEPIWKG